MLGFFSYGLAFVAEEGMNEEVGWGVTCGTLVKEIEVVGVEGACPFMGLLTMCTMLLVWVVL